MFLITAHLIILSLLALASSLPHPIDSIQHSKRSQPPKTRRTTIGGHGVVILPGGAPAEVNGGEPTTKISIGGSTYQVAPGVDTVIDGVPVEEYTPGDDDDGGVRGIGEEEVSEGKKKAMEFAEKAGRILGGRSDE
ncbi:hypothetical protein B0J18DRAFT_493652 [Chaetomium sp. MPI-SDFR-AT-0129]|nr:hypothetical protein B0J18DRAFT_493652 [Chaetomium sp. MPI-SDFR-AT-0129]